VAYSVKIFTVEGGGNSMEEQLISSEVTFIRNLIKGKIIEVIFEQMMTHSKEFKAIPLGYEFSVPYLSLKKHDTHRKLIERISENIDNAPDFMLISQADDSAYLVDVKYRKHLDESEILEIVQDVNSRWEHAWFFLATSEGFYFQPCSEIIKSEGHITPLLDRWKHVDPQVAQKYLQILGEFVRVDEMGG
jgi:hypothetical protein